MGFVVGVLFLSSFAEVILATCTCCHAIGKTSLLAGNCPIFILGIFSVPGTVNVVRGDAQVASPPKYRLDRAIRLFVLEEFFPAPWMVSG